MSAQAFEAFLARLYVDREALKQFRDDPRTEAERAGLTAEECIALEKVDLAGLELAANSFAHKRARKPRGATWQRMLGSLRRFLSSRLA